jgi:hypothetical protein
MSTRSSRCLLIALPIAASLIACGPTTKGTPTAASPSESTVTESPASSEGPPARVSSPALAVGQTDTDWGRIWDTVPAGFPRFPGSTIADDASPEPASARFAVPGGDPRAIWTWFQVMLEAAAYRTVGLNGPGEDGGFVLDSLGESGCRVQTTVAPLGDTTFITVLYGAACPGAS